MNPAEEAEEEAYIHGHAVKCFLAERVLDIVDAIDIQHLICAIAFDVARAATAEERERCLKIMPWLASGDVC